LSSPSPSPSPSPAAPAAASSDPTITSPAGTSQTTQKAERPEWLPESFWDKDTAAPKGKEFREHFDALSAFKAEQDVKRNTLPKSPDEYKAELPKEFQVPEGINYKIDPADPLIKQAAALAHASGMDQDGFSKLVGIYAGAQVAEAQLVKTARDAELTKLGPTASARVDSVTTWMKSKVGEDMAAAWSQMMVTAKHVELGEKLIKMFTGQGTAEFSQQHRDGGAGMSNEDYAKLSFGQKMDLARSKPNGARA
jgi:hypothetical protein